MASDRHRRGFCLQGELLKAWRKERDWTQLQAAKLAGISDRAIRKAESGRKVDSQTAKILAQLYSTPDRPLACHDLLATSATVLSNPDDLLKQWLQGLWRDDGRTVVDEMCSPMVACHCEAGLLTTRAAVSDRFAEVMDAHRDFKLQIQAISQINCQSSGRWSVEMTRIADWRGLKPVTGRVLLAGTTTIRHEHGRIVEIWDYWYAGSQMPKLQPNTSD